MIRFYKSYLGRLLLGLLILIELEKQSGRQAVVDAVHKWTPPNPDIGLVVQGALDGYINSEPETDDVLKGAIGQLAKKRNDDSDLLDQIVNILKLPFTQYFTGKHLQLLRDAVLTPSELGELKKSYKSLASCGCGHAFSQNEMVSASVANDAITLKCTKCARPAWGRCDHCNELVQLIGNNSRNALKDIDCGCRKRVERAAAGKSIDPNDNVAARQVLAQAASLGRSLRHQATFYHSGATTPQRAPTVPVSSNLGGYLDVFSTPPAVPIVDDEPEEIW